MKTTLTITLIFLALQAAKGQNLVPNPSFEIYDTCPNYYGGNNLSVEWYPFKPSPDYFNLCAASTIVGVPENIFGWQPAASGNAYIGMICYILPGSELIGCKLTVPLTVGTRYYVSFKVSLSDDSPCAIDHLGILFTTISYCDSVNIYNQCYSLEAPITNYAQVYSSQIISDTTNWTTITGSFIADSSYQYIIIGNLFSYSNTNYMLLNGNTTCDNGYYVYYYFDDICVSPDSITCSQINETNNILIKEDILIIPNPVIDFIIINLSDQIKEDVSCNIYNEYGILLRKIIHLELHEKIDVSGLPDGVYIVQIISKEKIKNLKIIINP